MFCPNCGKSEQSPDTYCRQCGTFLPDFNKPRKRGIGGNTPQEQISTNLFLNCLSALVSLVSAIVLYSIFWDKGSEFPAVYAVAGFLLAAGGWQLATVIINLKLKRNLTNRNAAVVTQNQPFESNQIESIKTNELLPEGNTEPINSAASVTEHTTRHLDKIPR